MKNRFVFAILFLVTLLSAQVHIAIIDFEGKNVTPTDASALTDRLRVELFLSGKFVVLEREKMDAILNEQSFQMSGCTSDACAVEVGQVLAVEQMVSGSVSKIGQTYSVTARLIGVEKGNLLGVGTCDLKGDIGDLMSCLRSVAEQLAGNQPVPSSEAAAPRTVIDIDGNVYRTVKIGTQVWMAENLKVTHFRNGDEIPNVTDNSAWSNLSTSAYCNYDNDANNATTYGRLYNWYAVNDSRNIAPHGWHVPTDPEWQILVDYLGGLGVAGGKMKETGAAHWKSPNASATNESGFSALSGGYREESGVYRFINSHGNWWSATESNSFTAWVWFIIPSYSRIYRYNGIMQDGNSVRCLKN